MTKTNKSDELLAVVKACICVYADFCSNPVNVNNGQLVSTQNIFFLLCDFLITYRDKWTSAKDADAKFIRERLDLLLGHPFLKKSSAAAYVFFKVVAEALGGSDKTRLDMQGDQRFNRQLSGLSDKFKREINDVKLDNHAVLLRVLLADFDEDITAKAYQLVTCDVHSSIERFLVQGWNRSVILFHCYKPDTILLEFLNAALYLAIKLCPQKIYKHFVAGAEEFQRTTGEELVALQIAKPDNYQSQRPLYYACLDMSEILNRTDFDLIFIGEKVDNAWRSSALSSVVNLIFKAVGEAPGDDAEFLNMAAEALFQICRFVNEHYGSSLAEKEKNLERYEFYRGLRNDVIVKFVGLEAQLENSLMLRIAYLVFVNNLFTGVPFYVHWHECCPEAAGVSNRYKLNAVNDAGRRDEIAAVLARFSELLVSEQAADRMFAPCQDKMQAVIARAIIFAEDLVYPSQLVRQGRRLIDYADHFDARREFFEKNYGAIETLVNASYFDKGEASALYSAFGLKFKLMVPHDPMHPVTKMFLQLGGVADDGRYLDALIKLSTSIIPGSDGEYADNSLQEVFRGIHAEFARYCESKDNEAMVQLWRNWSENVFDCDTILALAERYFEERDNIRLRKQYLIIDNLLQWILSKNSPIQGQGVDITFAQRCRARLLQAKLYFELEKELAHTPDRHGIAYKGAGESRAFNVAVEYWIDLLCMPVEGAVSVKNKEAYIDDARVLLGEIVGRWWSYFADEDWQLTFGRYVKSDECPILIRVLDGALKAQAKNGKEASYEEGLAAVRAECAKYNSIFGLYQQHGYGFVAKDGDKSLYDIAVEVDEGTTVDIKWWTTRKGLFRSQKLAHERSQQMKSRIYPNYAFDIYLAYCRYGRTKNTELASQESSVVAKAAYRVIEKSSTQSGNAGSIAQHKVDPGMMATAYVLYRRLWSKLDRGKYPTLMPEFIADLYLKIMSLVVTDSSASVIRSINEVRIEAAQQIKQMNIRGWAADFVDAAADVEEACIEETLGGQLVSWSSLLVGCDLIINNIACARFPFTMLCVMSRKYFETSNGIVNELMYCFVNNLTAAYRLLYLEAPILPKDDSYRGVIVEARRAAEQLLLFYTAMDLTSTRFVNIRRVFSIVTRDGEKYFYEEMWGKTVVDSVTKCKAIVCNYLKDDGDIAKRAAFAILLRELLSRNNLGCQYCDDGTICVEKKVDDKTMLLPQIILNVDLRKFLYEIKPPCLEGQIVLFNKLALSSELDKVLELSEEDLLVLLQLTSAEMDRGKQALVDINATTRLLLDTQRVIKFPVIFDMIPKQLAKLSQHFDPILFDLSRCSVKSTAKLVQLLHIYERFLKIEADWNLARFGSDFPETFFNNFAKFEAVMPQLVARLYLDNANAYKKSNKDTLSDKEVEDANKLASKIICRYVYLSGVRKQLLMLQSDPVRLLQEWFNVVALEDGQIPKAESHSVKLTLSETRKTTGWLADYKITLPVKGGNDYAVYLLRKQNCGKVSLSLVAQIPAPNLFNADMRRLLLSIPMIALFLGFKKLEPAISSRGNGYAHKAFLVGLVTQWKGKVEEVSRIWHEMKTATHCPQENAIKDVVLAMLTPAYQDSADHGLTPS